MSIGNYSISCGKKECTVKSFVLATFFALLVLLQVGCAAEPLMQVKHDTATGQYRIVEGKTPVLQYNYAIIKPPGGYIEKLPANVVKYAVPRSNYIHPLFGPEGQELTADWCGDHPHHRGIYWAWPEVQYQGKMYDLHALQNVFARPTGKIKTCNSDNYAEIQAENLWLWEDKTPIVREMATIRAWPANETGRYIDLTFTFTPLVDNVTLARRKTKYYGGLNIRMSPIEDMTFDHHADPVDIKPRISWQFVTGVWTGAKEPATLAVFEKLDNPGYPGDYIKYPKLPWFQPTFPPAGTRYELQKDKPLVLRYRLWICSGPTPTQAQCQKQWQIYQDAK